MFYRQTVCAHYRCVRYIYAVNFNHLYVIYLRQLTSMNKYVKYMYIIFSVTTYIVTLLCILQGTGCQKKIGLYFLSYGSSHIGHILTNYNVQNTFHPLQEMISLPTCIICTDFLPFFLFIVS